MRTANAATYAPNDPPADPTQLQRYLREEFAKIAAAVLTLAAGHLDVTFVAPTKPRQGDLRIASGPGGWDPGTGFGYYAFNGTAWVLIKAL